MRYCLRDILQENVKNKSRCNVRNCEKNPNVSLHLLQNEKFAERREKWISALQLPSNIRGKFRVCSNHFPKEDFRKGFTQNWLHHWAVPSLHLPQKRKVLKCLDTVNEVSPMQADTSIYDELSDHAESSVNEVLSVYTETSNYDEGFCSKQSDGASFMNESFLNSTPNHLIADEELEELEDELVVQIDSDSEDEYVADKGYENVESNHLSVRKHDWATQTDSVRKHDCAIKRIQNYTPTSAFKLTWRMMSY